MYNDCNNSAKPAESVRTPGYEVALTEDLINLLGRRRHDLMYTNLDHLDGVPTNEPIDPDLLAEITSNRLAAQILYRLTNTYTNAPNA